MQCADDMASAAAAADSLVLTWEGYAPLRRLEARPHFCWDGGKWCLVGAQTRPSAGEPRITLSAGAALLELTPAAELGTLSASAGTLSAEDGPCWVSAVDMRPGAALWSPPFPVVRGRPGREPPDSYLAGLLSAAPIAGAKPTWVARAVATPVPVDATLPARAAWLAGRLGATAAATAPSGGLLLPRAGRTESRALACLLQTLGIGPQVHAVHGSRPSEFQLELLPAAVRRLRGLGIDALSPLATTAPGLAVAAHPPLTGLAGAPAALTLCAPEPVDGDGPATVVIEGVCVRFGRLKPHTA